MAGTFGRRDFCFFTCYDWGGLFEFRKSGSEVWPRSDSGSKCSHHAPRDEPTSRPLCKIARVPLSKTLKAAVDVRQEKHKPRSELRRGIWWFRIAGQNHPAKCSGGSRLKSLQIWILAGAFLINQIQAINSAKGRIYRICRFSGSRLPNATTAA